MSIPKADRSRDARLAAIPAGTLAVLYPYVYWSTFPMLHDFLDLLVRRGWNVDLIVPHDSDSDSPVSDLPGVCFRVRDRYLFDSVGVRVPSALSHHGGRSYRRLVVHVSRPLARVAWRLLRRARGLLGDQTTYDCVLAIDAEGLGAASRLVGNAGTPIVYWSLEIDFLDGWSASKHRRAKAREVRLHHRAALTVSQDPWRASALEQENGLRPDPGNVLLVPNAAAGDASQRRTSFAEDYLGIPSTARIVLYAGHLRDWAQVRQLIGVAAGWPEPYLLVLHSRRRLTDAETRAWQSAIESGGSADKVVLSGRPLDRVTFECLLRSCHIGLALYDPCAAGRCNRNVQLMGWSSGKIADYLQCGLPVIASRLPGIAELLENNDCGVCVTGADDVARAIRDVDVRYSEMSRQACECFDQHLRLDRTAEPLLAALQDLAREA